MPPRSPQSLLPRALTAFAALILAATVPPPTTARQTEPRPFQPSDVHRLADVSSLAISPEGDWVAYSVRTTDVDEDKRSSDLYMVSWDGTRRVRLTHTEENSEGSPRFSPDGRYLAFLASRGGDEGDKDPEFKSQVWLLDRAGGEAQRLTELPGGVSAYAWSPDGQRLVLQASDPDPFDLPAGHPEAGGDQPAADADSTEPKAKSKNKTRPPIVIDRYQFKRDREGYLVDRYDRLYLFDLATRSATLLTPGAFDSYDAVWSPDGTQIAFAGVRPTDSEPDPDRTDNSDLFVIAAKEGAEARKLTTWTGTDSDPRWSPDGKTIAYLQGRAKHYDFYDQSLLALIPADGGTPSYPTEELDRSARDVRWSRDGETVYFHFDDDRERYLGSVPARGGKIERQTVSSEALGHGVVTAFEVGAKGVALLASSPSRPTEIYRLDGLQLSDHNRELREAIDWAEVRAIDATAEDGTKVGAMLYLPPDYVEARSYPTVAYIHGGPVAQDGFDFDWMAQSFAGVGFVVVQPNYRGSSGRGSDFTRTLDKKWADGVQDIHAVLDHLVEEGIADPEKLGIGGWSYGGISTNYAIATDDRFAAAVSGSGIANILTGYGTDQYTRQYENEIGHPWNSDDLALYLELSFPFLHADRIQTPTLFLCGEKDFNVPLINSEQMYQALRSLGVPTQLVIYPGQYHGLTVPSYLEDRATRMIAWFDRYLRDSP